MNKTFSFCKGLLLLCIFTTGFLQAQKNVNSEYATQINAVFANLDKSKIPHKILVDYGMEFAELSAYNGTLTTENILHRGHYTSIYNTLLMSRTQTNVSGLINPDTFTANWDNLRQEKKIVLSGLYYKYNEFKPDAPNNTITITNGKLYDKYVGGVWQNPYNEKQVFAMAAPILKYNHLSMTVQLPSALWYTNQASSVASIAIDFGNGLGYQTTAFGQLRTVTYTTPGLKEWKYRLTLTNNQVLYSHSKIFIDAELPAFTTTGSKRTPTQPCAVNDAGIDEVEFTGTRQYLGKANSAILEIDYAGTNECGTIQKPLIVVEGFDLGLSGTENPLGENFYTQFRRTSTPLLAGNLNGELNTYDIIYVNWKSGRDYMQRNAYLLEDIMKWVNAQKAAAGSTIPNVVLGQSMGGVIARYALRDMEKQQALYPTANPSWSHQTSLYISHDAPHQGANIPLAIQAFARHMIDQFIDTPLKDMNINMTGDGADVSIKDLRNVLNEPGTRQLLNNYVVLGTPGGFYLNNTEGDNWRTELKNMGYPLQTRNIAISNGSHCATPQDLVPLQNIFTLNGNIRTGHITDLILSLTPIGPAAAITLAYLFDEPALLLGVLPGNSKFTLDFYGKALPTANASGRIYYGKLSFTKTLFKLFSWTPRITVELTERDYDVSGLPSFDYYPGGMNIPFLASGVSQSQGPKNYLIKYGINMTAQETFNFIPATSALDVGKGLVTLNNIDYLRKYSALTPPVAPKDIPFHNFTTSHSDNGTNEQHISFNQRNGNWLAAELDTNVTNTPVFDCSYMCSEREPNWSDFVCTSQIFTSPIIRPDATYTWSISEGENLVTTTGASTQNYTLTDNNTDSGYVRIHLTVTTVACGPKSFTKRIWVGLPKISQPLDCATNPLNDPSCTLTLCKSYEYLVNNLIRIEAHGLAYNSTYTDWEWVKISNNFNWVTAGANGSIRIQAPQTGPVVFKVRAKNACGWTPWLIQNYTVINCPGPIVSRMASETIYTVYPNPANDIVNISLRDENSIPSTDTAVSGELVDMNGQIQTTVQINNNQASFSVAGLPMGIYVLNINVNGQIEGHQIAVE